jgi:hypothetical protein
MWQKGQAPDYAPWKGAQPYIDRLNAEHFAGYADWRLPTIEELSTLMSRERLNDGLYVSPEFSNKMWFWSCDPGGAGAGRQWTDSSFFWAINFNYGSLFCLETSNAQDIRAVRTATANPQERRESPRIKLRSEPADFTGRDLGELSRTIKKYDLFCKGYDWNAEFSNDNGAARNDFKDNQDGTVTDRATGLMWQKAHRPAYGRWEDAKAYVRQLNVEGFCGYRDWRLPTIEECCSLFTRERENDGLFISPLFTNRMWLWTSDVKDSTQGQVWNANLLYGSVYWIDAVNGQDIRAVRSVPYLLGPTHQA